MSITDELREWAHGFNGPWKRNEETLLAIADRIDAEHKKELTDVWDSIGDESVMAENGWVRLPKDSDGEIVHIGDVMVNLREELEPQMHHKFTVYGIQYRAYGQECALTEDGYPNVLYRACDCRHYHEPTVEDVLREFADRVCSSDHIVQDGRYYGTEDTGLLAEYAAKLQLRED